MSETDAYGVVLSDKQYFRMFKQSKHYLRTPPFPVFRYLVY